MNSEQFQEFLSNLQEKQLKRDQLDKGDEGVTVRRFLANMTHNTLHCMQYIGLNYTDVDLVQPLISQLLTLYSKGGALKQFALQFIPNFIGTYLLALSKKQHRSAGIFEAFFLAIYNEEIVIATKADTIQKKVDEIRIPSVRYRSIYHDPSKIISLPEIISLRPGNTQGIQTIVQIGPFPAIDHFTAEKKFFILSRILNSVNTSVCVTSEAVCRSMCLTALSVCYSGFSFTESNLRAKVLGLETTQEILDDYSKRTRQLVASNLLLELLTGCYMALYNGTPDLALRAIDAIHQRAQYEILPKVLLVTNSIRNSLLENPLSKERRDELMWQYTREHKFKDYVTNASLRMKKMPEDIPVQEDPREAKGKGERIMDDLMEDIAEGVDHIKKKMSQLSHHHRKRHHLKKDYRGDGEFHKRNGIDVEELELSTINEELRSESNTSLSPAFAARSTKISGETNEDVKHEQGQVSKCPEVKIGEADHKDRDRTEDTNDDKQKNESDDGGSFSVGGFRHMDSGSGTERSLDYS